MTRRTIALVAWLLTVAMSVAWVWVIAQGEFMASMLAMAPAEQSRITM